MARTPDTNKFNTWFNADTKHMDMLLTDFKAGKLNNTNLFKLYRRTARTVIAAKESITPQPKIKSSDITTYFQSTFGSYEYLLEPIDYAKLIASIKNDGKAEGVLKIDINDLIECNGEVGIKKLFAELLTGTTEFDNIIEAIDFEFLGGDCSGLYFLVRCIQQPPLGELIG